MKNRLRRLCVAALASASLALVAAPAQEQQQQQQQQQTPPPSPQQQQPAAPAPAEVPRFGRVGEHLYRGGQPTAEGFRRLAALGVRTVVNLRGSDDLSRAEEREARAAGLQYFNVPLPGYARPRDEQVERALSLIDAPENRPVFVHCKRGSDRTGLVVAAYRISREKWTADAALREAAGHGMSRLQVEMRDYVADYYERRAGSEAGEDLGRDLPAAMSSAARRAAEKSYAVVRHIGHVFR